MKFFLHGGNISWANPIQKGIQVLTNSEYWHIEVEYDERLYIGLSARYGGLDVRPYHLMRPLASECYIDVAELQIPVNRDKFYEYLLSRHGRKFDHPGFFALCILKILGRVNDENIWLSKMDSMCSHILGEATITSATYRRQVESFIKHHRRGIEPVHFLQSNIVQLTGKRIW